MTARIVVTLAVSAGLVACGGGGLAKEEYIARADEICRASDRETEDLEVPRGVTETREFLEEAESITRRTLERLRELEPPEEDEARIEEMLTKVERAVDLLPQLGQALAQQDTQEGQADARQIATEIQEASSEAQEIARAYGFKECGGVSGADSPPGEATP